MNRRALLAGLTACLISTPAIARRRRRFIIKIVRPPETKSVKTLTVDVCDTIYSFAELWRCRGLPP